MLDEPKYIISIIIIFLISFISALLTQRFKIEKYAKYIQGMTVGVILVMIIHFIIENLHEGINIFYYLASVFISILIFLFIHKIFHLHDEHSHNPVNTDDVDIEKDLTESRPKNSKLFLDVFLNVAVFSIHSFFEGLPLLTSNPNHADGIILGVGLHKIVESVCIGFKINASGLGLCASFCIITIYSLFTPLGMTIGYFFKEYFRNGSKNGYMMNILNGTLVGCFGFIALESLFHLFKKKNFYRKDKHGYIKFSFIKMIKILIFVISGGFIMGSMVFLAHNHDHEDHEHPVTNNTSLNTTMKPQIG